MNGRSQATKPICSDFSTACGDAGGTKSLQPIDPAATAGSMATVVQPVADPREPLHLDRAANRMWTARTILAVSGLAAALAGLALAWQYTSLRDFTDVGFVSSVISQRVVAIRAAAGDCRLRRRRAGGVSGAGLDRSDRRGARPVDGIRQRRHRRAAQLAVAISGLAGCWAMSGCSGCSGAASSRIQSRIIGKGVVAVAMIRMVPIAPFSIVNVVAGASKLSLRDFMLGTVLGMAPGIAVDGRARCADRGSGPKCLIGRMSLLLALAIAGLDRALPRRAVPGDVDGGTKNVTRHAAHHDVERSRHVHAQSEI